MFITFVYLKGLKFWICLLRIKTDELQQCLLLLNNLYKYFTNDNKISSTEKPYKKKIWLF